MNVPRNLLLLFLSLAAVNSRPNFLDDWDNQIWSSDSIDSAELGLSDMGLSEPQDITNFYVTDDVFPSISGDTALADSGFDGVITNTFQGSTEDGLSGPISSFNDGDALFLFPTNGDTGELAMDDICPDGYWNRCCNGGYCFWAPTPTLKLTCRDDSLLWCCHHRPVQEGCHYATPSGIDQSEVFKDVFTLGVNNDEICCRPVPKNQPQSDVS